jgi:hypothetical protein
MLAALQLFSLCLADGVAFVALLRTHAHTGAQQAALLASAEAQQAALDNAEEERKRQTCACCLQPYGGAGRWFDPDGVVPLPGELCLRCFEGVADLLAAAQGAPRSA